MTARPDDHDRPSGRLRRAACSIAAGVASGFGAGVPRSSSPGYGAPGFVALTVIAVLGFLWLGRGLPRNPWVASDTERYLQFSPIRPHGYYLFLSAYRVVFEDLAHLPIVQLGLYISAVLLLAIAVGRRTRSFAAAAATLLLVFAAADTTGFPYILSDTIYAAALTSGMAFFVLYAEAPRTGFLLLSSTGFGIALTFRAIGVALLPGFFLAVFTARIGRRGGLVLAAALSALPVALLYCSAASSQLVHNGRFALGSWGGMDVLGKLPLLARPVPENSAFPHLNRIVEAMEPARQKLPRLNPLIEALAARQYYEYLRWYVIVPQLERSWVPWRDGDDDTRGWLAAELAKAYVAEDPLGFLRRTAIDLAGLWAMPRWLTRGERSAALTQIDRIGELPFLTAFSRTADGSLEYYKIIPDPSDPMKIAIFRIVVVAFWAFSVGFLALVAIRRGKNTPITPELVLIVLAVHAVYLGTALMEGLHERYIMPTWPALVAGPILALGLIRRLRRKCAARSGCVPTQALPPPSSPAAVDRRLSRYGYRFREASRCAAAVLSRNS